jgi:hypothetical protein
MAHLVGACLPLYLLQIHPAPTRPHRQRVKRSESAIGQMYRQEYYIWSITFVLCQGYSSVS